MRGLSQELGFCSRVLGELRYLRDTWGDVTHTVLAAHSKGSVRCELSMPGPDL